MMRISASYNGRCCKCGTGYTVGQKIGYDGNAVRGKKAYCLNCAGSALLLPDATEAEIARLRQQLDEEHGGETPVAPTPKPAAPVTTADPLAAAIANAIEPLIRGKLDESRVVELIEKHTTPKAHMITVKTPELPEGVNMGRQHKQFEDLLVMANARDRGQRLNVWVTGVAGTGKTTALHNVSKALGLRWAATGALTETYKLFGHMSPGTGKYVTTEFREIWEHGGVFCFDDFDRSDPHAVTELNNALANGSCSFPDKTVPRHSDCFLGLSANTFGGGGTNDYVGAMKQDAAFLDRFAFIDWQIDEALELDTCPIREWAERVQTIRRNVQRKGIKVLVTPRASYYGAALLQAGMDQAKVEASVIRKGMTAEQWASVC